MGCSKGQLHWESEETLTKWFQFLSLPIGTSVPSELQAKRFSSSSLCGVVLRLIIWSSPVKGSRNPKREAICHMPYTCFHMIKVPFMGTFSPSWVHLPFHGHIFPFHGHHLVVNRSSWVKSWTSWRTISWWSVNGPRTWWYRGNFQEVIDSACLSYFNMISPRR